MLDDIGLILSRVIVLIRVLANEEYSSENKARSPPAKRRKAASADRPTNECVRVVSLDITTPDIATPSKSP